jgi:sugar lactone lactonase YvrE
MVTGNEINPYFFSSKLSVPQSIAFDNSGNLSVSNIGRYALATFNSVTGNKIKETPIVKRGGGLAFDKSGNYYISDSTSGSIVKYKSLTGVGVGFLTSAQGLSGPRGITWDSSGNLYVANSGNNTIGKYNSVTGATINSSFISVGLNQPYNTAFDSLGNLYVVNSGNNTIGKYNGVTGAQINQSFISSGLFTPRTIAFDSLGNLYVVNSLNNTIGKYNGVTGATISAQFISGLNSPYGIAFDSLDNLYATSSTRLLKYTFPKITSISPNSGVVSGNTIVTINGSGFDPSGTTVTIGGFSATDVVVGNIDVNGFGTSLTCKTPTGTSFGSKNVVVTTVGGFITLANGYAYIAMPRPTIASITADVDNAVFTIVGTNFVLNNTTVIIGDTNATNVDLSGYNNNGLYSTITCSSEVNITERTVITVITSAGSYSSIYRSIPISNICFLAGTLVTTDQGIIAIEKINPKIHTIRKNEIVAITKTVTQDKYLVCFEKDSLGENIPSQKTVISRDHKLFYKGNMMRAKDFVTDFENVKQIKYSGEPLYNVLLKEHEKMIVNNLICETLHPENSIAKLYKVLETLTPEKQQKLIEKVNAYVVKNKCYASKK